MNITTHATTRPRPLGERIADIRREARSRQKKPVAEPRERWDCGVAAHHHETRQEAVACIDGVLKP